MSSASFSPAGVIIRLIGCMTRGHLSYIASSTTLMRWTAPERHLRARMRLLSSSSWEAVHGRDYNDRTGFGEACVPGSWHRRRGPGDGATADPPRRVAEVLREAVPLSG